MSEGDWSSSGTSVAPPKKRIPLWVWGCGGGCAVVLLVGVVLGVFGIKQAKKYLDPEVVWPSIDAVLPVVERPEGLFAARSPVDIDGVQVWLLTSTDPNRQRQVLIFHGPGGEGTVDTRNELFGPAAAAREGSEVGTLTVQGRERRTLRYRTLPGQGGSGGLGEAMRKFADGANVNVEFSPPEGPELLALTYTRGGQDARVSDEELLEFLAHFRLPDAPSALAPPPEAPAADGAQDE